MHQKTHLLPFEEFKCNWSSEVSSWRNSACLCIWSAYAGKGWARPKEQGRGGGGWQWIHLPDIHRLFLQTLGGWPKACGYQCLSLQHWVSEGECGALCLPRTSFLRCSVYVQDCFYLSGVRFPILWEKTAEKLLSRILKKIDMQPVLVQSFPDHFVGWFGPYLVCCFKQKDNNISILVLQFCKWITKPQLSVTVLDGNSVNNRLKESLSFQCIVLPFVSLCSLSGFNIVYSI